MIDPFIAFVLLAAIVAVSIGSAKLVSWCLDRRGVLPSQRTRSGLRSPGTRRTGRNRLDPDHETLYQAEIAATKRGDLLAAANYAEQREAADVR